MNFSTKLMLLILISTHVHGQPSSDSAEVGFDALKLLVGTWKVQGSETDFRIQFELTANETVLMETWLSKGKKHSLTVYHLDGKRLMATHYCPQGNQPRLVMSGSFKEGKIEFEYLDATNLGSIEDSHQHHLAFVMPKGFKHIERIESYLTANKENTDQLVLERDQ
ncbi:hypothetical protein [Marinicella meishanensis]|uniref:hypothetical protein n=1 Tax=Marinicella meishanensis TaxID=2873263 RepID=UPI001CBCDB3B|nr:hypothetical protein [Marinicella sp. NBU2979]